MSSGGPHLNPGEDEEDEAIRIAIALSLGEDPDKPPLGTPPRPTELARARAREARHRAQERQRIRIRDQAKDAALHQASQSYPNPVGNPLFPRGNAAASPNPNAKKATSAEKKNKITVDLTLDDDDDDDVDDKDWQHELPDRSSKDVRSTTPSKPSQYPENVEDQNQRRQNDEPPREKEQPKPEPNSIPSGEPPSGGGGGVVGLLGGLDRKKMEEERLARLKKRKASELIGDGKEVEDVPTGMVNRGGATETRTLSESRPYQRQKLDWPSSEPSVQPVQPVTSRSASSYPMSVSNTKNTAGTASPSSLPFPRGVVKKTWSRSQPRLGDDIKIEELLQKDKLKLAVLSSFQWDDEWLVSKLDLNQTRVILIAFAADEAQQEEMESNVPRNRIRFCFPHMQGIGAMHSKLQLLKYDDYLRIVVPTGNLVPYDWGETGVVENMVFIIDLPKLDPSVQEKGTLTTFGQDLLYFLSAQGLDDRLVESLKNYDFSETERYGFVHSICGSHSSEDAWRRTGYCGLGRVVDGMGLGSKAPIEVDFVCASLGAVNDGLLNAIYYACQGDDGLKEYEARATKGKAKESATVRSHMRVYFPSEETVTRSRGGKNGAGTICFQSRWYQAPTFPREVLRDCKSTRDGMLIHSKMIFVRLPNSNSTSSVGGGPSGFVYVGSANLSESAWGRLVKDRGSGKLKITCRNWECGVLLPADSYRDGHEQSDTWRIFGKTIPVPMELPGAPLSEKGPRAPWFFQDRR